MLVPSCCWSVVCVVLLQLFVVLFFVGRYFHFGVCFYSDGWVDDWMGSYSSSVRITGILALGPPVAMRQPEAAADLKDEVLMNRSLSHICFCGTESRAVLRIAICPHLFHIYLHLKCNLLSSHPSSSLHVSAVYGHHQVSSVSLKLLHCMSRLRIACERDFSGLK
jgi:hypothetical protein